MLKLSRKKSPLHQGVIYLVMPREVVANEDVREDSLSPPPHLDAAHLPEVSSDGKSQDVEYALDEEDEKEQSFSVPASPTLSRRPPPLVHIHGRVRAARALMTFSPA